MSTPRHLGHADVAARQTHRARALRKHEQVLPELQGLAIEPHHLIDHAVEDIRKVAQERFRVLDGPGERRLRDLAVRQVAQRPVLLVRRHPTHSLPEARGDDVAPRRQRDVVHAVQERRGERVLVVLALDPRGRVAKPPAVELVLEGPVVVPVGVVHREDVALAGLQVLRPLEHDFGTPREAVVEAQDLGHQELTPRCAVKVDAFETGQIQHVPEG
jgi:hypothetical protein